MHRRDTVQAETGKMQHYATLPDEQVVQVVHNEGASLALALLLGTTHTLVGTCSRQRLQQAGNCHKAPIPHFAWHMQTLQ